ncbi:HIT family protein [Rhodoligotrophos defluvii]|uniref:HIT family protein n=1 Tax=Rhodoligotrophos defluvii TaxID=2561934 RepID=UPI0010C954C7|nr:HIT family protein [Rhodoligotrophos defluvii]
MNATIIKFGFPDTLIKEYEHWCVLLRPAQATLGALVLARKGEETAFGALPPPAYAELGIATRDIEASLKAFRPYDRINYLMLMMVDPHVHFHVLPRYQAPQSFEGVSFADKGWPAVPDLGAAVTPHAALRNKLVDALKACWAEH